MASVSVNAIILGKFPQLGPDQYFQQMNLLKILFNINVLHMTLSDSDPVHHDIMAQSTSSRSD